MLSQDNVSRIILAVVVLFAGFVFWRFIWNPQNPPWNGKTAELNPKHYKGTPIEYKGISIGGTRIMRKKKTKQKNKK